MITSSKVKFNQSYKFLVYQFLARFKLKIQKYGKDAFTKRHFPLFSRKIPDIEEEIYFKYNDRFYKRQNISNLNA